MSIATVLSVQWLVFNVMYVLLLIRKSVKSLLGPPKGGSGAMCYVQKSLACYVLCKFLFTLLCEIKIGCYAEVQPVLCAM